MPVDHNLFQNTYTTFPAWGCPTCDRGHLRLDEGTLANKETGPSKKGHAHEGWDPEWIERRFSGILECDYPGCGDLVAIFGTVTVHEDQFINSDGNWEQEFEDRFRPHGLVPPPLAIRPVCNTPANVQEMLREASGLIWQSTEASANQIRQAVELLMDDQGVTREGVSGTRRRRVLTLHDRIKEFEKIRPEEAEVLLAVKWLGNSGSHPGGLQRSDVLDAFDMIEMVLDNLYSNRREEIMKKVKAVNAAKGPTSRHLGK